MPSSIRAARPEDVARLEEIENAADRLLIEALHPGRWEPASPGEARAIQMTARLPQAAHSPDAAVDSRSSFGGYP